MNLLSEIYFAQIRGECFFVNPNEFTPEEKKFMNANFWMTAKKTNYQGIVSLQKQAFTTALCCFCSANEEEVPYYYRFCYPHMNEALNDFEHWDGKNLPQSNWIKRKSAFSKFPEISNPNYKP